MFRPPPKLHLHLSLPANLTSSAVCLLPAAPSWRPSPGDVGEGPRVFVALGGVGKKA